MNEIKIRQKATMSYKTFDKIKKLCIEEGVERWDDMTGKLVVEALEARELKEE